MRTNPVELGIVLFVVILIFLSKLGESVQASKKKTAKPKKSVSPVETKGQAARQTARTVSPRRDVANDHDHIPSTELSWNKKLEQLKVLKNAGLLTNEEYADKVRKALARK